MKRCPKCKITKSFSLFYQRKTGKRAGEYYEKCKDCMKARGVSYYHLNRERQLPLALARKKRAYAQKSSFIRKLKDRPCADCGKKYPFFVMDFDHIDKHSKRNNISSMLVHNWSLEKIKKEVEKCDIVCANCHRIRTFGKYAAIAKLVTAGL